MSSASFRIRQVERIDAIPAQDWDACANPAEPPAGASERFNPFLSHAFLAALEVTGCVGRRAGWFPAHLVAETRRAGSRLARRSISRPIRWANMCSTRGWPKLISASAGAIIPRRRSPTPFTPVQGRRLLVAADAPPGAREALLATLRALPEAAGLSSLHVTFPDADDQAFLAAAGMIQRRGQQFHFFNRGYSNFDDFLGALASRKRKAIRKERAEALGSGLVVERVTGRDLTEAHWDAFFEFYTDTGSRKWGRPYLTRAFFSQLSAALADRILLVVARRDGRPIAGALNLIGDDALYGRNWGAIEHHPCLHFELCYYQAIEFAIERGLKRVEAGAQGEHKFSRGYEAVPTFSAHDFADPRLAAAAADFFARETRAIDATIAEYAETGPFRKA